MVNSWSLLYDELNLQKLRKEMNFTVYSKDGCPYCSNKKAGYGNDLESFFPDISKIWHPSNNGSLKPSQLTPGSSKRIYLLCNNGHERTILVKRFTKFPDCPRCKKIK